MSTPIPFQQLDSLTEFYHELFSAFPESSLSKFTSIIQAHPERVVQFDKAFQCSEFFQHSCKAHPERMNWLVERLAIDHATSKTDIAEDIAQHALTQSDVESFNTQLRRCRNFWMAHIIYRDINHLTELTETTHELTYLAEACLDAALQFHYPKLCASYGAPRNKAGVEQPMLILGMGKLGAYELNLSSDIDLIFCYPEKGETDGEKSIENQDFFNRLGKRLIQSLDSISAEGFVFRVDMRLRPYGQSGALVSHFLALEDYYQTQGREWERYAMVKARIVAHTGEKKNYCDAYQRELMQLLREFTYRKYIDFSVIEALRKLKTMIRQEVRRRKLDNDIKLGAGGIREVEFIAQVFQLIRGGRDTALQDNRLHHILPYLEKQQYLPAGTSVKLLEAYTFLRKTEHAIQAWQDQQTQKLPIDTRTQQALVLAMNFENWDAFYDRLQEYRDIVSAEFEALIGEEENVQQDDNHERAQLFWQSLCESDKDTLLNPPDDAQDLDYLQIPELIEFAHSPTVVKLNAASRERLDLFMPRLLSAIPEDDNAAQTLKRILPLIKAIVRRSAYLVLLIENPNALKQLIRLSATSQHIADDLTAHPALLDELLDSHSLYSLPEKSALQSELQQIMLRIEESDLEQQMESLRYFKLSHSLRVAACEVSGALPLMKVSDYLTMLAEIIVDHTLKLVWRTLTARHGYPDGVHSDDPSFLVVAYGKFGGIEMNHGSDLDLVFIHNATLAGETDGDRAIDNQTFYTRLGQKIIHMINTQMASGRLYEVDMRLRPSGNSGLLVTSLTALKKYQRDSAWTWEHQALVRARPIAGSAKLAEEFQTLRHEVLMQTRDLKKLQQDIVDMRLKMRDHLGSKDRNSAVFNLKQDAGGIVDIEFMVQYLVLAWSHAEPALATYTDNIRILEALAQTHTLSAQEVEQLIAAYKALRVVLHRLTITQMPNVISANELKSERQAVIQVWQRLFAETHSAKAP